MPRSERFRGSERVEVGALLSIVLALSIETLHAQRPTDLVNKTFVADVTRVADGDTVEVLIPPARKVRIRLHGVDTPEAKEPFSNQARTFTRVLMFGRRVTVVGKDVDRYDRLVARIAVDNVDASESIIATGLGCTFRQYVTDPALESALASARTSQRGFWAAGAAKPACVARGEPHECCSATYRTVGGFRTRAGLAERVGFEPTVEFPLHTLSKRAP